MDTIQVKAHWKYNHVEIEAEYACREVGPCDLSSRCQKSVRLWFGEGLDQEYVLRRDGR